LSALAAAIRDNPDLAIDVKLGYGPRIRLGFGQDGAASRRHGRVPLMIHIIASPIALPKSSPR
jgi:hypothetical protein